MKCPDSFLETMTIGIFGKGLIVIMDENFKKQLEENGVDVDATLKRFMGKDALFMKFIVKFADDENCNGIRVELEKQDIHAAFERAHSLKGVAGNLGITPVYDLAAQISDLLRGKQQVEEVDMDQVMEAQTQLEENCERICCLIEQYKSE